MESPMLPTLTIPELALVVLLGPAGAGKSTFARRHFRPTEILSSDACRALVADDEGDQSANAAAFEVLHVIAAHRLAAGRLTVIDATNAESRARQPLVALAREYYVQPVAIVLDPGEATCVARSQARTERPVGAAVIQRQAEELRQALPGLAKEGFRLVYRLSSAAEIEAATVIREPLPCNLRSLGGPFDVIGDVHGCFDELSTLLERLGYQVAPTAGPDGSPDYRVQPPPGRIAIFVGDLIDRGPRSAEVLRLVLAMVRDGVALCLLGNHDDKLRRRLMGREVALTHGLAETVAQLDREPPAFRAQVRQFLEQRPLHYVLDGGRLVVAHAGLPEAMHGRVAPAVRDFALYGATTGETDEYGLPVRLHWAADYRGAALVVYGHVPVPSAEWINHTIDIDTACGFGGALTALRYPERELVSVPARRAYATRARPIGPLGCTPPPPSKLGGAPLEVP
jgi:protein phosphatase